MLLTSNQEAPHGFRAKVADFGLARALTAGSRVETRSYGTVTHMPFELLCSGILSKVRAYLLLGASPPCMSRQHNHTGGRGSCSSVLGEWRKRDLVLHLFQGAGCTAVLLVTVLHVSCQRMLACDTKVILLRAYLSTVASLTCL